MFSQPLVTALVVATFSAVIVQGVLTVTDSAMPTDAPVQISQEGYKVVNAEVRNTTLRLAHADTSTLRERGLSGRTSLQPFNGMLFSFDTPDYYSFWMKDMHFPIDMLWLDSGYRVVDVVPRVMPDTFPATFTSVRPAQYIVELPSGDVDRIGIQVGDLFTMSH